MPTIPDFFAGKNIFVTGGTGFMGKVLIEKLLRSCPEIENIFVLVRRTNGKNINERVEDITESQLFDVLKKQNGKTIKKIIPISGDISQIGLEISEEVRELLIEKVNIVYHIAASIRFDDPLRDSIVINTRGTREVINLASKMKNLIVFMHISTAYCNCDHRIVEEEFYPPCTDWENAIKLAEEIEPQVLNALTEKLKKPFPNTYTFSKRLAEYVVVDLCRGKIPAVVLRPSIVISTAKEPFPGWLESINGSAGMLLAAGKGVMRTTYAISDIVSDNIPVDVVIKGMIISTWQKGVTTDLKDKYEVTFYNACYGNIRPLTGNELNRMSKYIFWDTPMENALWYPNVAPTNWWPGYFFRVLLYSLIPVVLIDGLMKIFGHKPYFVKITRKLYIANLVLHYFVSNEWNFKNGKFLDLEKKLLPKDFRQFSYDHYSDKYGYFKNVVIGLKKFWLKEKEENLERTIIISRRMWLLAQVWNFMWYIIPIWLIFFKFSIINFFFLTKI